MVWANTWFDVIFSTPIKYIKLAMNTQHAPSFYAATANPQPERAQLQGKHVADVCIVGAGYTGLSSALHLAEAGYKVIVLESAKVG